MAVKLVQYFTPFCLPSNNLYRWTKLIHYKYFVLKNWIENIWVHTKLYFWISRCFEWFVFLILLILLSWCIIVLYIKYALIAVTYVSVSASRLTV